ncbi:hypothetical protein GCM10011323_12760 [Pontibacter amylolyticus]|uniref:Uncharacterized protein n=2 Tax=Pontibacter amylolyticus TaxID=1424080 RepID=A0ABQ1W154_9BACT|nr:hypothetical protein GCM10011323_12760 [Pontibacter amylolyticus]
MANRIETGTSFAYISSNLKQKLMKKLMTLVLVGLVAFGAQVATAADYNGDKDKGKKKGKPSFVEEKHRAHAEWKREKEYEKARKKEYKDRDDDDDRWEDRRRDDERWERRRENERRDDDRWERRKEDEKRAERQERERWEKRDEQRRNRSLGEILQEGVRNDDIGNRSPDPSHRN